MEEYGLKVNAITPIAFAELAKHIVKEAGVEEHYAEFICKFFSKDSKQVEQFNDLLKDIDKVATYTGTIALLLYGLELINEELQEMVKGDSNLQQSIKEKAGGIKINLKQIAKENSNKSITCHKVDDKNNNSIEDSKDNNSNIALALVEQRNNNTFGLNTKKVMNSNKFNDEFTEEQEKNNSCRMF